MTRIFASAAIASAALLGATLASGVAAQASDISDRSQLEASVGITPAEGRSLTLTELAAKEFDRSSNQDNQMMVVHPGPVVATPDRATMSSRSPTTVNAHLIAGAGLTQQQAAGMTLNDVAKKKFDRDNSL